jgi:hypothetical protein
MGLSIIVNIGRKKSNYTDFCESVCVRTMDYAAHALFETLYSDLISSVRARPFNHKLVYIQKQINDKLNEIEDYTLRGVMNYTTDYISEVQEAIEGEIHFNPQSIKEHIKSHYLIALKWNLDALELYEDYAKEPLLEGGYDKIDHYASSPTLLNQDDFKELGLFYVDLLFLYEMKLIEKQFSFKQQKKKLSKKNISDFVKAVSVKTELAGNPDDIKKLISYFNQDDLSVSTVQIALGCSNQVLWYILHRLSGFESKFKLSKVVESKFFKSSKGTLLKRNNLDRAKTHHPEHKSWIDRLITRHIDSDN